MRLRVLLGSLFCVLVIAVFLLDREVLHRPLVTRSVLLLLALGVVREVVVLAGRRIETGPGLFATGGVALVVVSVPHIVTGTAVPGSLIVVAALLAGTLRLLAMAPVRTAQSALPEAAVVAGAILYGGGLLGFLDRIVVTPSLGIESAYAVAAISKSGDICAYLGGTLLGRKRIVPTVSPQKTWEGTILGLLASAGVAALLAGPLSGQDMPPGFAAIIGLLLGAATFLGDLIASGIKRWAGVKDSAPLIKEFGGVLDLVDGVLFAGPVAVICLMGT